ncbi:MAG: lysylphosphatidylglycerol synthase domain-containing protein, partial [Sinobacteraceae bacterium]|nr:lysylphosphatidylglycerol synthase domain-containing protein [Nevskiaceae bacterium]
RLWGVLFGLAGLGLALWVVFNEGVHDIIRVLDVAGWSLLWLIPLHLAPIATDARGWQILLQPFDPQRRATPLFLLWVASVREAIDRLLPVANVGGELVGIRLLLLRAIPGAAAAASVLVEVLVTIISQYLFTATGLVLLVFFLHDAQLSNNLSLGLIASAPLPVILYFLLRNGRVFEHVKRGFVRTLGARHRLSLQLSETASELDHDLRLLLNQPGRLARTLAWQFAGMAMGSFETWFTLILLGHPIGVWEALTLESLWLAVRNFAFFIPVGLGVQEASFLLFGGLIGLPADVSVALALTKRLRDVGFGLPAMLSWQWVEGRALRTRLTTDASETGKS